MLELGTVSPDEHSLPFTLSLPNLAARTAEALASVLGVVIIISGGTSISQTVNPGEFGTPADFFIARRFLKKGRQSSMLIVAVMTETNGRPQNVRIEIVLIATAQII